MEPKCLSGTIEYKNEQAKRFLLSMNEYPNDCVGLGGKTEVCRCRFTKFTDSAGSLSDYFLSRCDEMIEVRITVFQT